MTPRIAFIVPVRNDAERLARCLRSINACRRAEDEMIVADNGSRDGSPEVAVRLGARLIRAPGINVAALRNAAARVASGDILSFVDADNEIVPGWGDAARDALRPPGVGAAGARYSAPADGTWVQRAYGFLRGRTTRPGDVRWLAAGNMAIWRHVFEEVGGFDAALEASEDVDLCNRLTARGFRIVGDDRLQSVHHGDPRTLTEVFVGELWRGRDNLRVSMRPPRLWKTLASALIPVVDAALLPVAIAGGAAALAGWPGAHAVAAAAGLGFACGASLKVVHAVVRDRRLPVGGLAPAFCVACVYDAARALALVARARHRTSRYGRVTPAAAP